MLLELLLFLAAIAVPVAYAASGDGDADSSNHETYESYESIRVYPSERKAIRYYDGEIEEYYY